MSYTDEQMQLVMDSTEDFYKMGYDLAISYAEIAAKYEMDIVTYLKNNKPKGNK